MGRGRVAAGVAAGLGVAVLAWALLASGASADRAANGGVNAGKRSGSKAVGKPWDGRLINGVRVPSAGRDFFTWDSIQERSPNRPWRRWGTRRLVRTTLGVIRDFRAADPTAPRVAIGDLSRRRGGDFGPKYGGLGHASHQNGLDVDVYYPRRDGREIAPTKPSEVSRRRAQALVDLFVAAGAEYVFVGPSLDLRGPKRIVQPLAYHDDHLHFRLPKQRRR